MGSSPIIGTNYRGVAQMVVRYIWDVDAAGSNPVTPTKVTQYYGFLGRYSPLSVRYSMGVR